MRKNILITGPIRSGKSTVLRGVIEKFDKKVGFVTEEVIKEGKRAGFEMKTSFGDKKVLAHIDLKTSFRVARYFVDINNLEKVVKDILSFSDSSLLYLDEIGQMQLYSNRFKALVTKFLDSSNVCIATISAVFDDNFINEIKKREDVILVKVSPENREEKIEFVKKLIGKIEKAKKYLLEKERFTSKDFGVELKSEHGIREITVNDGRGSCNCSFFISNKICSHVIATEEYIKLTRFV